MPFEWIAHTSLEEHEADTERQDKQTKEDLLCGAHASWRTKDMAV